jgi:MFS family permease
MTVTILSKGNADLATAARARRLSRFSVSVFFLMHGLCFSAWASRIPTVQVALGIGVTELGVILLALPLGFFISLPFSGWMISRLGSRRATILSAVLYIVSLVTLAICSSVQQLMCCLFLFGFFANALNLSMNTQAVEVEKLYKRRLLSTFHGLWSIAGFAGAAIGAWSIGISISLLQHFSMIAALFIIAVIFFSRHLVKTGANERRNEPFFVFPEKALLLLGAIAFFSAMIEGAMFDWTGIYFKDIVKAGDEFIGLGYASFMIAMAIGRFCADSLTERLKLKRVLVASGILITTGLLVAVAWPAMFPVTFAFILIGAGVSSVVPLVYSTAGKSKTMATGTALTAVASLGFVGFLLGPPLIGFVAGLATLKGSFLVLMISSGSIVILSSFIKQDR